MLLLGALFVCLQSALSLNNGLLQTPPMGWLSWAVFGCQTNCLRHPLTCISENLYMDMADRLVEDGYADAGYNYVNIDDCWSSKFRSSDGHLQADPKRFSSGIKALSKYMHDRGLKLGIYGDYGLKTCGGYPGSLNYLKLDAETFAQWDVDMLKFDGCAVDVRKMAVGILGYPEMELYLNKTGRKIAFSCSWPAYESDKGIQPSYTDVAKSCNMWRSYDDIQLTWKSVMDVINWMDKNQDKFSSIVGPGQWNDPDMLIIGHPGLTEDQSRVQMALWSIWSAPLLMSNDLRYITKAYRNILLNEKVIAVNQDRLGRMGTLYYMVSDVRVYKKSILPQTKAGDTSFAFAFFNSHPTDKATIKLSPVSKVGMINKIGYNVTELFSGKSYGILFPDDHFEAIINPTGVVMISAVII